MAFRATLPEKAIDVVQVYLSAFVRRTVDAPQIGKDNLVVLRT